LERSLALIFLRFEALTLCSIVPTVAENRQIIISGTQCQDQTSKIISVLAELEPTSKPQIKQGKVDDLLSRENLSSLLLNDGFLRQFYEAMECCLPISTSTATIGIPILWLNIGDYFYGVHFKNSSVKTFQFF
jgi:hypothetical protein